MRTGSNGPESLKRSVAPSQATSETPGSAANRVGCRRLREGDLDLVDGFAGDGRHVFHREQAAIAHERHAVADALHLGQQMGREKDGPPFLPHLVEQGVELVLDERVETGRGLVQDQQVRPVHERLDEGDLALVARRELPYLAREVARQSFGELIDQGPVDAVPQGAQETKVLGARQVTVEGQLPGT